MAKRADIGAARKFEEGASSFGVQREATQEPTYRYAGFWIRFVAFTIDFLIFGVIFNVALVLCFVIAPLPLDHDDKRLYSALLGAFSLSLTIVTICAIAYFNSGPWQASPGKQICGLYIIRLNGERVTFAYAILRYLAYYISSMPAYLGFAMIGWHREKAGLHDLLLGSRVVYGEAPADDDFDFKKIYQS